ncbi:dTDP-4-dehydrorhamnose reductase [Amphritea atlantica]|uniref:dTDP-4-dehydrorhamnose reductase n=1 Tax=Amphritea atlantica TaxID=355243 RepID=A0A1H9L5K6_9GAMM|nr:SDR family oxidoreductase [Amphritea atlantica]SER06752.1 dTDP-4-dehydrorhamnose reductase [Amphritea atlantica]
MTNKILVLGANGMLGGSMLRYFSKCKDYDVLGSVRDKRASDQLEEQGFTNVLTGLDVSNFNKIREVILDYRPNYLLNCIGVIKQLDQSKAPVPSIEINSLLPHKLAAICDEVRGHLIHFSTDCVFSGKKGNYKEGDLPDACDLYGRSKLLGEVDYGGHLTLRTSIIGHEIASNISLVDWFLSQKKPVRGYANAIFSGLPTVCIAEFIEKHVIDKQLYGLYHLSSDPIDKFTLLSLIKDRYSVINKIEEYADFKIDRSLNSDNLKSKTGFISPSWEYLIKKMHDEYIENFE